jgi:hypothetical protein
MNSALLTVPVAFRAELTTAVAAAPDMARLFTSEVDVATLYGDELLPLIQALDEFLRTHRAAPRAVRLFCINLRHALTVRREAEELEKHPETKKDLLLAAERLGRKSQSGFSPRAADDTFDTLVNRLTEASR